MGKASFHWSHQHNKRQIHRRADADASCATGSFYSYPTSSTTLASAPASASDSASIPVNITWDYSLNCLSPDDPPSKVDIYLYEPSAASSKIHMWSGVSYSQGYYEADLLPKWWNASSSANLQFTIIDNGDAPFLASIPAGPIFTATYTAPSDGTPADADTSTVSSSTTVVGSTSETTKSSGLSKGKIAAAVIMPLLLIGGLIFLAWFKLYRAKQQEKSKRWSEVMDKRMSTISTEWKPMSPAGANAAVRNSIAVNSVVGTGVGVGMRQSGVGQGMRSSSFSFGQIRPISSVSVADGGQAGIGARAAFEEPPSHLRQAPLNSGERQSRISFAPDTRPSMESTAYSRNSRATSNRPSRAFHSAYYANGDESVPPIPNNLRQNSSGSVSDEAVRAVSPTQRDGPARLTADDIATRMSMSQGNNRVSAYYGDAYRGSEDVGPALEMMRSYQNPQQYPDEQDYHNMQHYETGQVSYPSMPAMAYGAADETIFTASPITPSFAPAAFQPEESQHSMFSGFAVSPATSAAHGMGSPDEMLRQYAAARVRGGTPSLMSPPISRVGSPAITANTPTSPSKEGRRLTYNAATPGTYSLARGAYGVIEASNAAEPKVF